MALSPKSIPVVKSGARFGRISLRAALVIAALVAVAIAARLAAPYYVRHAINQRLGRIPGYWGQVGDIDLNLWRGGYTMKDFSIVKREGGAKEPFFAADQIDFSVDWGELFHRKLVSQIIIENGRLNFVQAATEQTSQVTVDKRWQDVIDDLFPIDITYLEINHGVLRYANTTRKPPVDFAVTDLRVVATGLRNRPSDDGETFPAKISLSGQSPGHGQLRLFTKLEPLAERPHLELNLELRDVSLPVLNDFLRAYAKVDVSKGRFELFGQLAMNEGRYEGYVKPFFDRLDFKDFPDQKKDVAEVVWEKIVAAIVKIVKNKPRNQLATRIPFSGEAGSMDVRTWTGVANALHHGFIEALHEGFEGTTHPDSRGTKVPDMPATAAVPDKPKSGT